MKSQIMKKEEEYIINISMLFCFNCEKCGHLKIEFLEGNETENPFEIKDNYEAELISSLDDLKKERE